MTDAITSDLQSPQRRNLLLAAGVGAAALGVASFGPRTALAQPTSDWDKVFRKSDLVDHQKVSFTNRYGIRLVGDLYMPRDGGDALLPALAVAGPFGAVKEQSLGLHAQTMAERGFVALAFDPSYTGESGGEPRLVASPDINTEDTSRRRSIVSACAPRSIATASGSSGSAASPAWR